MKSATFRPDQKIDAAQFIHGPAADTMFRKQVTADIELALIELPHVRQLFDLTEKNRSYLRAWLPWLDTTQSTADTSVFVQATLRQFAENKGFQTGIWCQGKLCGLIGFHEIDRPNRSAVIGYWLDADHQNRGIMSASCRAMVTHGFANLGLNRLIIRCATENRRSRAIPERLGFSLEGISRQAEWLYDHFVDHAVYALLQTDKLK